jgi:hypothetical protein
MANSSSDILNYNLGVLLRLTMLYQNYDLDKYTTHVEDLLSRAQFYYTQGLGSMANSVLKEITDGSIRGYYTADDDTIRKSVEEHAMQQSLQMMQQYSPELLQHYNNAQQQ